jgi:pimeloyl-ACP methyl ester carboxylesterase
MRRIGWRGRELGAEVVGHGPATVLFVHGLGADHRCFAEATGHLDAERFTLVMPDLPGFGQSSGFDDVEDAHSMASMAEALAAVIADMGEAGDGGVHLVAHSMGGAVALLLAGRPGARVLSFACAEGNLVAADGFMSSKVSRLTPPRFERVWTKWLSMVEDTLDPSTPRQNALYLESLRAAGPRAVHRASTSCWDVTASGELATRFLDLDCPRLYLVGERTAAVKPLPAPVLEAGVPVAVVPGVGHALMENAAAFYPRVRELIERSPPRG